MQLTGRDRNRVALESELLGALSVQINKVLLLSGDQPDDDGPMAVNELNSNGLIQLCKTISEGSLTDGQKSKTLYHYIQVLQMTYMYIYQIQKQ